MTQTHTPGPCPLCRKSHEPHRGLSFDGCGINSCGSYASRIATFSRDLNNSEVSQLGPMFAASPDLLEALAPLARQHTPDGYSGHDHIHCSITVDEVRAARAAIARATGQQVPA